MIWITSEMWYFLTLWLQMPIYPKVILIFLKFQWNLKIMFSGTWELSLQQFKQKTQTIQENTRKYFSALLDIKTCNNAISTHILVLRQSGKTYWNKQKIKNETKYKVLNKWQRQYFKSMVKEYFI